MYSIIKKILILKKNQTDTQVGFTLIEVLVTLVVFAVGLVAIYTLSEANINATRNNFRRTLAANLGREAIELIRNRRDSNWLAIDNNQDCDTEDTLALCTWDYGLKSNFVVVSYEKNVPEALTICASFDDCLALGETSLYAHDYLGEQYYNHIGWSESDPAIDRGIKRVVRLQAICRNVNFDLSDINNGQESISNSSECLVGGTTKIGLQVTARLQWYYINKLYSIDIVEKIYNWR